MIPARRRPFRCSLSRAVAAASLLALLAACVQLPRERTADDADTARAGDAAPRTIVIRRVPPRPAASAPAAPPPATPATATATPVRPAPAPLAATPPAPAVVASAPAAPKPPPEPEFPLQALPSRQVAGVQALSDAEALGPIIEKPVPDGGDAPHAIYVSRPPPPPARPVYCKAQRSRNAGEEKIAISCGNTGKTAQTVFLQIEAVGLDGVPGPEQARSGYTLRPGQNRQLITLTAVSRPTRVDIFFTHAPYRPG